MSSKFLLIALSAFVFSVNTGTAERAVAQAQPSGTPQPTRPRVTFFEQEQKIRENASFGNEDFLQSALSGTTMAIEDPAKFRPNGVANFSGNLLGSPTAQGRLVTGPLNSVETALTNANFISGVGNITFNNVAPSSNPQTGTASITGNINGQNVTGTYNYNAGYSRSDSNGLSRGTILLVNPNNPSLSILIQAPTQQFNGGNSPINGPSSLTIGLPKDR